MLGYHYQRPAIEIHRHSRKEAFHRYSSREATVAMRRHRGLICGIGMLFSISKKYFHISQGAHTLDSSNPLLPVKNYLLINGEVLNMDTAQLIQAAANIVGPMAASQYGKFGGMEAAKIQDIAMIAVKIARQIEVEANKP